MNIKEYQKLASRTRNSDMTWTEHLINDCMGLVGESGELIDHFKKVLFHGHELDRGYVAKEIGDQLWYLSDLCETLDMNLECVAIENIEKLKKRYPDGFDPERSKNRHEYQSSMEVRG